MQITMHLLLVQLLKTKTPWLVCGLGHSVLAPRLINKQNLRCAAQAFSIVCFEQIKIGKVHPEGEKNVHHVRPCIWMKFYLLPSVLVPFLILSRKMKYNKSHRG